jgi:hypothetical protein
MARSTRDRNEKPPDSDGKNAAGAGAVAGGAAGGVAGAALAGAAVGGLTGPAGAAIGAAVGAAVGALGGRAVNWAAEESHWKDDFSSRPYVGPSSLYVEYEPAYRLGYERSPLHGGRPFEEVEPEFERDWAANRGTSPLAWQQARFAVRDAYERARDSAGRETPVDADRDAK